MVLLKVESKSRFSEISTYYLIARTHEHLIKSIDLITILNVRVKYTVLQINLYVNHIVGEGVWESLIISCPTP